MNPITDKLVIPIVAYKIYCIMQDLINYFYNEKMRIKYIKEGFKDYRKLRQK